LSGGKAPRQKGIESKGSLRAVSLRLSAGNEVLAPGPGHSPKDRSLAIKSDPKAPGGFIVHSFAGDDQLACKNYVRDKLGIHWEPTRSNTANPIIRMQRVLSPAENACLPSLSGP
jgi:hypothetical protein